MNWKNLPFLRLLDTSDSACCDEADCECNATSAQLLRLEPDFTGSVTIRHDGSESYTAHYALGHLDTVKDHDDFDYVSWDKGIVLELQELAQSSLLSPFEAKTLNLLLDKHPEWRITT